MHAHRAPSTPSLARRGPRCSVGSFLVSLVLAGCVLGSAALPGRAQAQAQARAIVLSFEGWRAEQARAAVANALGTQYELVSEEQAINAAAQIAVDVSTPEGMASVVQHLGIELVVGGSVAGTGRRSTTTIFVLDRFGNQIGGAEAPGPTGSAAAGPIGQSALAACAAAMNALHPPPPVVVEPTPAPEAEPLPPPEEEQPPMRTMEEIENETPGQSRGQGGARDGGFRDGPSEPVDGRWNQPVFRGLLQADIRNRTAGIVLANPATSGPTNLTDFFPQFGAELELRPMANSDDGLRGLYARIATWFSAGINYFTYFDADPRPVQIFGIEADLGYALTIGEAFELLGAVGFGYDTYSLQLAQRIHESDFASTAYPYLPILLGGRVRLLPASVGGVDLHLEAMVGPRVLFGGGQITGTSASSDSETALYFANRTGDDCRGLGTTCSGDFGSVSGAGINFYAGLGLIVDPGFSAALRFQYTNYFLGFSDGTGSRGAISGNDESLHIQVMLGWSVR